MIVSASALVRNCGYVRVLKKDKPRTPEQQGAIDKGTAFHQAGERWLRDGLPPVVEDLEMQGWIDLLAAQWRPTPSVRTELAWGLGIDGGHVHVSEPKPHVYESMDGSPLLTAGRADACWLAAATPSPGAWDPAAPVAAVPTVLVVVDWKTGRWPVAPADENLQINAAGLALAHRWRAKAYRPAIYYVRDGHWDWGADVWAGSAEHAARFAAVKAAAELDEAPRAGDWCASCWERKRCEYADRGEPL